MLDDTIWLNFNGFVRIRGQRPYTFSAFKNIGTNKKQFFQERGPEKLELKWGKQDLANCHGYAH